MKKRKYKVGSPIPIWREGMAQTLTFIVTEDCNLRCKYCYITHKSSGKRMNFETAKQFIDYILSADINYTPAVIIEFIGGEPFLETELIDQITDYFKIKTYDLDHPWFWNYRISISTNGVNYSSPEVQNYIKKNKNKTSIGITLDGTKEKHDLQRVFPDGKGSYDSIIKSIPLYLQQSSPTTKVTFASDDLIFLKESILNLWENGITEVAANVVFEDVWKEGDELIFEEQLKQLADYILENQLFDKYYCSFFSDDLGAYENEDLLDRTSCGAGQMIAIGPSGLLYPCLRYKDYSMNNKKEWLIGDISQGIDMERVRPFMVASNRLQSDEECNRCPIGSGCSHCQGFNYDVADTETNYQRAKYICKMHKARVRANEYYFGKLSSMYGIEREDNGQYRKLYFLLSDDYITYCCYDNKNTISKTYMTKEQIEEGLNFCRKEFFRPVFVHSKSTIQIPKIPVMDEIYIEHIIPVQKYEEAKNYFHNILCVFDKENINLPVEKLNNTILNIHQEDIKYLSDFVICLFEKAVRVNVNILNLSPRFPEELYKKELMKIAEKMEEYINRNEERECNLISDLCYLNYFDNCRAGERSFVYTADQKLYTCAGLYAENLEPSVGTISQGLIHLKNAKLYTHKFQPICQNCDTYQCRNCIYTNKKATNEVNVSPSYQCRKSHIEREVTLWYQKRTGRGRDRNVLTEIDYRDPIVKIDKIDPNKKTYYIYKQ